MNVSNKLERGGNGFTVLAGILTMDYVFGSAILAGL